MEKGAVVGTGVPPPQHCMGVLLLMPHTGGRRESTGREGSRMRSETDLWIRYSTCCGVGRGGDVPLLLAPCRAGVCQCPGTLAQGACTPGLRFCCSRGLELRDSSRDS